MPPSPADPHLPTLHLRPPRNWLNDPNGLSFHDGHYHVFHQYNPHGPEHSRVHWGHFRSPDLLDWEELPVALAPTPGGDDADGCFSGNAVSHAGRLIAFYSACRTDRWWQPVATAQSRDGGLTWAKRPELLIPQPPAGTVMYRDPYVWRDGDRWRMLVGAGLTGERGAALLYESPDLETWRFLGPFLSEEGHRPGTGGWTGWECPQYAAFGDRGALVVSLWDAVAGPNSVRVYVGAERDGVFVPAGHQRLDHGPDFYAPALLHAPDGRWLLWGWSWEAREAQWSRAAGWAGVLTLPREISLTDDGRVRQRPAREIHRLRGARLVHASGRSAASEPVEAGRVGPAFDLTARLRPDGPSPAGLRLTAGNGGAAASEYLDITVDPVTRQVVADRDHASRDPRAHPGRYVLPLPDPSGAARDTDGAEGTDRTDGAGVARDTEGAESTGGFGGAVDLRVIVDGSIVEIFLSTGEAMTLRWYPTAAPPWRLQILGSAHHTIDVWSLGAAGAGGR